MIPGAGRRVRFGTAALAIAGLILSVGAMLRLNAAFASPRLVFATTRVDAGTVLQGERLTRRFSFTNAGASPLSIVRLLPSCSCTAVNMVDDAIAPGATGTIEVVLDTADLSGSVTAQVEVQSNDPRLRTTVLSMTSTVQPEIVPSAHYLDFGDTTHSVSQDIQIVTPRHVSLLSASSTDDDVTATLIELAPTDHNQFRLVVTQRDGARAGLHHGLVIVSTTSAVKPRVTIPVRSIVRRDAAPG